MKGDTWILENGSHVTNGYCFLHWISGLQLLPTAGPKP